MKRTAIFLLALMLMLVLTACGPATQPENTGPATQPSTQVLTETTEPSTQPTAESTEPVTQPQEESPRLGSYADGVYSNDYLGVKCTLTEEFTVATKEELAQLNGVVAGAMSDQDLAQQLLKSGVAHAFYAIADEGLVTINIAVENLGLIYGTLLDEESYVEHSIGQLPAALKSMGLVDIKTEAVSLTLAGKEHAGVTVHGTLSGVDFYEKLVCIKNGSYMTVVTVGSYYEDITDYLLSLFSAI